MIFTATQHPQWRFQDFREGVGALSLRGAPGYEFIKFSQKLHEIEKHLAAMGGGAPLDPPMVPNYYSAYQRKLSPVQSSLLVDPPLMPSVTARLRQFSGMRRIWAFQRRSEYFWRRHFHQFFLCTKICEIN